jgi:hypothetical protein
MRTGIGDRWHEVKEKIKALIPDFVLRARSDYLHAKRCRELEGVTPKEVFTRVYAEGLWGHSNDPADTYYSGTGAHAEDIVSTYVSAVERYLKSCEGKIDVVDLGCGDFSVGSRIRRFCGNYIACDVVEPLILRNREKFKELNVDFRVLDLTTDELPGGELAFVKQVLQHLSNKQIAAVLAKLENKYRRLIVTEHLPASKTFVANLDKPVGADIRLGIGKSGSGIVITEPPFNFRVKSEAVLCEMEESGGIIRTIVYELFQMEE